jgi:hypothetical protein
MRPTMKTIAPRIAFLIVFSCCIHVFGQAEVTGWGNLRGIRFGGQLVEFTTAVGIYNRDFSQATLSQREGPTRTTEYLRDGDQVSVAVSLQYGNRFGGGRPLATNPSTQPFRFGRGRPGGAFNYRLSYLDSAPGVCQVRIRLTSPFAQTIGGVYYFVNLPSTQFSRDSARLIGASNAPGSCMGFRVTGSNNSIVEVDFPKPLAVVVQQASGRGNTDIQIYFPIAVGNMTAGQVAESSFTIKASGDADVSPATVTIDPTRVGRTFDGMGGNYRIQNDRLDPLHIQYILDHMRVAYGRVAMPWNAWQPDENSPPSAAGDARGGAMNSTVAAMEIARKLALRHIPMIISCWSPAPWAVLPGGGGRGNFFGGGPRGQRLDPAKWDKICKSIGSYLLYLKDHYGAEPLLFSFNESNIGINVRQSPQDHDQAIKKLGAYFKSIGLKTKMLLGDTGDVPPINFIQVALSDPDAAPFIGAVSFHSWRGATDEQYQKWADTAAKLGVPLIDAEGGNDAQAAGYPSIFREEWYSLDEAAEYIRIMRICQPRAILEWQLTENYSVLRTDEHGALQPTQRFYNLKQFNLSPPGSAWIAASSSSGLVLPAACFDQGGGICTVHLVNNGADRPLTVNGLPTAITRMNVYVTDQKRGMAQLDPVMVNRGTAQFTLPGQALTTLITATP